MATLPNNYVFTNEPVFSPCAPTNIIGTNITVLFQTNVTVQIQVAYQVLMVDATTLTTVLPVTVFDLVTHSPNVVVDDNMTVVQNLSIDAANLTLNGDITIPGAFPINPVTGAALTGLPLFDWRAVNAPRLQNFTNNGNLTVLNEIHFGDDRPFPYLNFLNTGTITGYVVEATAQAQGPAKVATGKFTINCTIQQQADGTYKLQGAWDITREGAAKAAHHTPGSIKGTLSANLTAWPGPIDGQVLVTPMRRHAGKAAKAQGTFKGGDANFNGTLSITSK